MEQSKELGVLKIKCFLSIILNEPGFHNLIIPASLPGHFQIISRYSLPYACQMCTLRPSFPLALEREAQAKVTRRVGVM